MLLYIFNFVLLGVGSHFLLERFFPKTYGETVFVIFYNCVYAYSFFEKCVKKILNNKYLISTSGAINNLFLTNTNIDIIKNNRVISSTTKELISYPTYCDFLIYSDNSIGFYNQMNKIIYFHFPHSFDYVLSNVRFINTSIFFNDGTSYYIKLSSNTENYYVVDNIINKVVLFYLIKQQHGVDIPDDIPFTVKMIDENVNIFTMTENDLCIIKEQKHHIVKENEFQYPFFKNNKEPEDKQLGDEQTTILENECEMISEKAE